MQNQGASGNTAGEETTRVGESQVEQTAPVSTVARERMITIIANSKRVMADCEEILVILNSRPDLDAAFCRLFGITNQQAVRDVSK